MSKERQAELFAPDPELPAAPSPSAAASAPGVARVLRPNRTQLELRPCDLESLLAKGLRARLVWAWVERCDLSAIYAGIRAVQGGSGRSAIAPEILFALWLYATLEGVGSARAIARLALEHDAYRWICGGVSVNCHALSDFRSAHGEVLDALLTDSLALLMAEAVVRLKQVAQDGARVRASAGAASFRTGEHRAASSQQPHEASKPCPAVAGERDNATPPLRSRDNCGPPARRAPVMTGAAAGTFAPSCSPWQRRGNRFVHNL